MINSKEEIRRKINKAFDTDPSPNQIFTFNATLPYIKNKEVLDIGCWSGQYEKLAHQYVKKIIGIDPGKEAIQYAKMQFKGNKKLNFKVASAQKLPFKDNTFDTVVLTEVIEHIPKEHEEKVFGEVRRVLKNNGIFVVTTPYNHFLSILGDPAFFLINHRHYSKKYLTEKLSSSGFKIISSKIKGRIFQLITNNLETLWKHILHQPFKYPKFLLRILKSEHKKRGYLQLQLVSKKLAFKKR